MLLLAVVVAVAVWRTQSAPNVHRSLEQQATAVAALESARARFFLTSALLATPVFAEHPASFRNLYGQAWLETDEAMAEARTEVIVVGELEELAAFDRLAGQMDEVQQQTDVIMASLPAFGRDARIGLALQYLPRLWPVAEATISQLGQLAQEHQTKLAAERGAADRAGDVT
jgi:hypothetical protein